LNHVRENLLSPMLYFQGHEVDFYYCKYSLAHELLVGKCISERMHSSVQSCIIGRMRLTVLGETSIITLEKLLVDIIVIKGTMISNFHLYNFVH
jgi:hypothetical protein